MDRKQTNKWDDFLAEFPPEEYASKLPREITYCKTREPQQILALADGVVWSSTAREFRRQDTGCTPPTSNETKRSSIQLTQQSSESKRLKGAN